MAKNNKNSELVLDYFYNYKSQNGYYPSVREICNHMGFSSTSTAFYYLNLLERQGKIKKGNQKSRALDVICYDDVSNKIPLIGAVAAGTPIFAEENIEDYVDVPNGYFASNNEELFVLKVKGDSMINAGILDGDEIVVKKQDTAENGEIVVALIDDSATVKRFYKENGFVRLMPENPLYEPIIEKDVKILGVLSGLIRRYK